MSAATRQLMHIVRDVEHRLADFYRFTPSSTAVDHLVTRDELRATLGHVVEDMPEFHARAGVFLSSAPVKDELFIGIHVEETVRGQLERADPTQLLDDSNLDAYCVLVEEISHFHLILNRAHAGQGVSKLELEWQGEIDKLLVCALTLKEQQGDAYLEALAHKLYDNASILSLDTELYWNATRYAARFWRLAGKMQDPFGMKIRELLRQSYRWPWDEKLAHIA